MAARLTPSIGLVCNRTVFERFAYVSSEGANRRPEFTRQWDYREADTAVGAGPSAGTQQCLAVFRFGRFPPLIIARLLPGR